MARMHSRKHGKSGSNKPVEKSAPSWLRYSPAEVEKLVLKLAKAGVSAAQIGLALRDSYGIPSVSLVTEKTVSQILADNKLSSNIPDDLMALFRKNIAERKHFEANHKDMTCKRGLQLTESKVRRLVKYYKGTKKLPEDFKFDPKRLRLFIE